MVTFYISTICSTEHPMIPYHHLRSVFLFVFISAYTLYADMATVGKTPGPNTTLLSRSGTGASVAAADNTPSAMPFSLDKKTVISASSGLFGIGAGIAGIIYALKASDDYDSSGMHFSDKSIENRYYRHYQKHFTYSTVAFIGSGVGIFSAAYFYFFHFNLFDNRQASLIPRYTPEGEIGLTMELRW